MTSSIFLECVLGSVLVRACRPARLLWSKWGQVARATVHKLAITSLFLFLLGGASFLRADANSVSVSGTVKDPSGAVIPGATVTIYNPVTGFERTVSTDATGGFSFPNVP